MYCIPPVFRSQILYRQQQEMQVIKCQQLLAEYAPSVADFLLRLALKRNDLERLYSLLGMGLKADDIRRFLTDFKNVSLSMIVQSMSRDVSKFIWKIPFSHRGRFSNWWQRLMFWLKYKLGRREATWSSKK
jgi:hypothetical protein